MLGVKLAATRSEHLRQPRRMEKTMPFQVENPNLYDYDIYPKVMPAGREVLITIRPLGAREQFHPGQTYTVGIKALTGGKPAYFPIASDFREEQAVCGEDGCLRFRHTFTKEQQYFIDIAYTDHRGRDVQERFSVYCVDGDLVGRYPFIGDLHTHTTLSDGSQIPEVVCANYRKYGYDFIAITDHRRYYPSLRAIRYFKDLPTELHILPGEEVHLPKAFGQFIDPHIISIGAEYSVNAIIERDDVDNIPIDENNRSLHGVCPKIMNQSEYEAAIQRTMDSLDIPEGLDRVPAAGIKWAYDEIRRAGGLAIYPHPMWIHEVFHNPDILQDFMLDNHIFDVYEVLGGENYFEQNGFQTVRYYEDKARGHVYPIVGSTDSHSSNPNNRNALITSTIIFSEKNETKALMDAIRGCFSLAVDTISKEFRLVGDMRLVRYACFLLKNYFPLHDEVCMEEGRLLKQYVTGGEEDKANALKTLNTMVGRVEKLRKKYFAF